MVNFFHTIARAINATNVASIGHASHKYSKYVTIALFALIIYQLYLATFARENFDTKTKTSSEEDTNVDTGADIATSCAQFATCSDCINGKVSGTSEGCYWNPTCKKCGSFKDEGYSRSCDAKSDPTIKCGSTTGDSRPLPQKDDNDKEDSSVPAAFDDTVFSSGIIPLPYNDFDGAKTIVGGAAGSENGCPVCPKLTLLKTPTYITTQV
jgi:hypothetical protein